MRRTRLLLPRNQLFLVSRRKSPPRLLCHLVPPGRYSIYRLVPDRGATLVTEEPGIKVRDPGGLPKKPRLTMQVCFPVWFMARPAVFGKQTVARTVL